MMRTVLHLPADLLVSVDRQTRQVGVSRNHYVVRAIERALAVDNGWSLDFIDELEAARADVDGRRDLEELRAVVADGRTRKETVIL